MLEIKNLTFSYDNKKNIFEEASLTINENGIYFIKADNGTGKTTLFKILKGILKTNDSVFVDGINNNKLITFVDYNFVIEHKVSVYEQCLMMTSDTDFIDKLFSDFDIENLKHRKASKLSQGEKAKVAFILGILDNNQIMIIDEIFSHLDSKSSDTIVRYMYMLSESKIIIYSAHKGFDIINYDYLIEIVDKKLVMNKKDILTEKKTKDKFDLPKYNLNIKYLKKILNYNSLYFVNLMVVFLICFLGYLVYTLKINNAIVADIYIKNSSLPTYVVDYLSTSFDDGANCTNFDKSLIPLENKEKLYKNTGSNYIHTKETGNNSFFKISGFFVTEKRNLKDDEIIMFDYDYFILTTLISQTANEPPLLIKRVNIYDLVLNIKEVIDTGFIKKLGNYKFSINDIFSSHDDLYEIVPNRIARDKDFIYLCNYYYNNIFVNNNLYKKLIDKRKSFYENSISNFKINDEIVDVTYGYDTNSNNDKINNHGLYLNSKYKDKYKVNERIKISFTQTFNYESNHISYYTILGFIDSPFDIILPNKRAYNIFISDFQDDFVEYTMLDNYTINDLIKIYDNDNSIIFEQCNKFLTKTAGINNLKINNMIILISLSSLIFISLSLYMYFILNYRKKSLKILKNKNIDNKIIKRYNIQFLLQITLFLVIVSLVLIFLLTYYNVYYNIIFKIFYLF